MPFCQNHELKNKLKTNLCQFLHFLQFLLLELTYQVMGSRFIFPQLRKVKGVLFLAFSWKNNEFYTLTP
jgi:hypothetical protein